VRAPNVGSNAVHVGGRFKTAHVVKTNTGRASSDALGLTLELVAAAKPEHSDTLTALGSAYTTTRDAVRRIETDPGLSDLGRVAKVRELIPQALGLVAESRQKVARMRAHAHNTRLAALRERTKVLDERAAKDPEAVTMMVDILRKLDPIIGRQRVQEAAAELGQKKERYPFLLPAARRARQIGLESENPTAVKLAGRPIPVVDDETHAAVEETLVSQASNAAEVAALDETAALHAQVLAVAERSVGKLVASYDAANDWDVALAALPADGGSEPAR
jgi:hypothetical protein